MIAICALDECNETFARTDRRTQLYCCPVHARRDHKRKTREAQRANRAHGQPYFATVQLCEVDGRAFTADLISRGGRPRKYDCERCNEIAKTLRAIRREEQ